MMSPTTDPSLQEALIENSHPRSIDIDPITTENIKSDRVFSLFFYHRGQSWPRTWRDVSSKRDKTERNERRRDNDDNVDDRYHGGASSVLTPCDFRSYDSRKEILRVKNFANARL